MSTSRPLELPLHRAFVPCQPLQALMKIGGHPRADFLSLDVEGSELGVIQNTNVSAFGVII